MLLETEIDERRTLTSLSRIVDEGLDLAEQCGWRYALAYLISERVPPAIIQRLLSGGGRARENPADIATTVLSQNYGWQGRDRQAMEQLFEALQERRAVEPCPHTQTIPASRRSVRDDEND